jgi:hypothetical protein
MNITDPNCWEESKGWMENAHFFAMLSSANAKQNLVGAAVGKRTVVLVLALHCSHC